MGVYTDDFNRSDANDLGGNWTALTTTHYIGITSNRAAGKTGTNNDGAAYWSANAVGNDQYSEADIIESAPEQPGVIVRASGTTSNRNWYGARWEGTPLIRLFKIVSNSFTSLGTYSLGTYAGHLRLEVVGDQLSVYVDDVLRIGPVTDTSLTSGSPGVFAYNNGIIDNWEGGDLVSATVAPRAIAAARRRRAA